ncbi:HAD-superfamily phosphatase [Rozella allomycis CSF55]|uniref:HAD-superfamily phosphatase n=1 Tax=Rozella allomycis (strain CSF55) TaxID=988480 RepID=A0A075AVK0_ROZAC|nr:HAD-superfamily phosphatase, subfamily IIIA domain-containing protein [Rozella allomycis CSF55]RKP20300.1 HAD-superfamily phosphatase [Rozella allomycis CSF55]|eukprot:EPZ32732.1 HAD-superfamily phosphatase, subfamily IIIA domain-containing protein [Rozella allomycis CSF55]
MGINRQGFKYLPKVYKSPSLIVPCFQVKGTYTMSEVVLIRSLAFEKMKDAGIKAICFDKDNVLTAPYVSELYPSLKNAWEECQQVFKDKIAILSNSAGSMDDIGYKAASAAERSLKVPVIRHRLKKPDNGILIIRHFQVPPQKIVVVGDRLFTDILMGNMDEMLTIHTQPLTAKGEELSIRYMRKFENTLLQYITTKYPPSQAPPHPFYRPSFIRTPMNV